MMSASATPCRRSYVDHIARRRGCRGRSRRWPGGRGRSTSTGHTGLREARGDVDRGRRLADAALLVRDCIDPRHRMDPTAAVGRIRRRAAAAWPPYPGRRGKRSGVGASLPTTSTPGHSGGTTAPARAAAAKASSSPASSRDQSTMRPPGRQSGRHSSAATGGGASARATTQAQASRSRPRATSSERSACTLAPTPIAAAVSVMNAALRAVDSIRCNSRSGRTTPSTRPGRPPPLPTSASGPGGAASTAGRPASASRTCRAGRSGSRIAVTPIGVEQTRSTSSARRSSCVSVSHGAPSAMTARATHSVAVSRETSGWCST